MPTSGSVLYVWRIFASWLQISVVQPFSQRYCCCVLNAVADAGERAGPGLDAELMPPEQPSGSRWWNRLPGRGGGGGLGSRGGSQGDLQHGEAPLSAAQQARDRLSRYSHFFVFHSRVCSCSPKIFSFLPLYAATACYYRNGQCDSMQCPHQCCSQQWFQTHRSCSCLACVAPSEALRRALMLHAHAGPLGNQVGQV